MRGTVIWYKLGLVYRPEPVHPKLASHAANPLPIFLDGDVYRVLFSGRDAKNRSSIGAVDLDIVKREVVQIHRQPLFEHGPDGSYYADGVSIGNCYEANGHRYILFMGWQSPPDGHWRGDVGRLVLNANCSLRLDGEAPFLGRDPIDPISLSYPWVMPRGGGGYDMWYGSTLTWDAGNGEMLHVINHASSPDGTRWKRHGLAVPYEPGKAQAFSRPTVVLNPGNGYDMWFSYRSGSGQTYRIGSARSEDGISWILQETSGIDVSATGWDSEMIEYPHVFSHKGELFMLYNGNGYGKTGFGLAVLSGG